MAAAGECLCLQPAPISLTRWEAGLKRDGKVDCLITEEEINLTEDRQGWASTPVGGTDQQYVSDDSGIAVSRIKEEQAAAPGWAAPGG